MSPFSHFLHKLRLRYGIRQAELAQLLGCEQSHISSLEVGGKGPPTSELVQKLIAKLSLSPVEQQELHSVVAASQRKLVLEPDSSEEVFWLLNELREQISALHPAQIKLIREALHLKHSLAEWQPEPVHRIRRRRKAEAAM